MTQFSKTQIETLLGSYTPQHLRAIISRTAALTPDVIYGSGDIDPFKRDKEEMKGVVPACLLLAAHGANDIGAGMEMMLEFKGLSNETSGPYGDWNVEITHSDIASEELASDTEVVGEEYLVSLPTVEIRTILSDLARKTPATLYLPEDFGQDHGLKTLNDGSTISATSQAGMFLCSKLRDHLEADQYWQGSFVAMKHASRQARLWKLKVMRHSD